MPADCLEDVEYSLHSRLGYKVSRLARVMETRLEGMIAEFGVTRMMWCVLSGVGLENVKTPSALARYIGIARPTVSRVLSDMEKRGFIYRSGAKADGRAIEIELTDLGRNALNRCRPLVDDLNAHFMGKLEPRELEVLLSHLDSLAEGETRELNAL